MITLKELMTTQSEGSSIDLLQRYDELMTSELDREDLILMLIRSEMISESLGKVLEAFSLLMLEVAKKLNASHGRSGMF
jgi:hypothetical protein